MKLRSGPFKGMKVEIAEQDVVDQNQDIVDEILDCIGIRAALVTDESELSDFSIGEPQQRIQTLAKVNSKFGLALTTAHIRFPLLIEMILKSRRNPTRQ